MASACSTAATSSESLAAPQAPRPCGGGRPMAVPQWDPEPPRLPVRSWDFPLTRAEALCRLLARTEAARRETQRELFAARGVADLAKALAEECMAQRSVVDQALCEARVDCDKAKAEASALRVKLEAIGATRFVPKTPPLALHTLAQTPERHSFSFTPRLVGLPEEPVAERATDAPLRTPRGRRLLELQTPRSARLKGSVAQVMWQEGDGGVRRLAFLRRTTGQLQVYGGGGPCDGGERLLRRGEYLVSVNGRSAKPPNIAEWLTLDSSEGLSFTIGSAAKSEEAEDISFTAAAGMEVVGLRISPGGELAGIVEEPLPSPMQGCLTSRQWDPCQRQENVMTTVLAH